jgi:S-DNA-T family DNA segregation ATPase FtsK/SpoIIIE
VIIIDEYAELIEEAPKAIRDADTVARLGRAVAVSLIAATQRPTQRAMGRGAVRSQMDIRVSFRVRERRDVDLILGQGMLDAGWHAHTLNAPGKFLISAPEHDTPRRARAYLLTDDIVSETASRYPDQRPPLDEISRLALEEAYIAAHNPQPDDPPGPFADTSRVEREDAPDDAPEAVLWTMLSNAPDEGIPVPHLMQATGKSRRWVYYRLEELAKARRAARTTWGRWRAIHPNRDDSP